uniref:Uncharacterized protein n=1 Tax=Photinus pyralis TaxID=7054 RepID=A0A1Y1MPB9_PHOPY
MAEFEILGKVQRLRHGSVTIVLEHHHRHGFTGNHVTDDKLGQDVQTNLDVRDTLDQTNRDEPNDGEKEADDKRPGRKTSWPTSDDAERNANHDDEQGSIPPILSITIFLH